MVKQRTKSARWAPVAAFVMIVSVFGPPRLFAQCGAQNEAGWTAYRANDVTAARAAFNAALKRCPADAGALTGLSYVALRQARNREAALLADSVLKRDPNNEDAMIARGIAAMRLTDNVRARRIFAAVLARNPARTEAKDYLAQLMPVTAGAPARPPLLLPDTLVSPVRISHRYFEISGERFYVKGVNLGAALPGRHPSEFPDSATYADWIAQMHEMGANVIRVYTIHPPAFYQALLDFNRRHASSPVRLIHGVWTELPPGHDFDDVVFVTQFQTEMRRVIDLLHGRADIAPRPGHASGFYTADVSPWVLAYITGREWEPFSVVKYNRLRPAKTTFPGKFLRVDHGSPMEVWLARMSDYMIGYETERYRAQRPMAFTNWPTLDPLKHPTESTIAQELAMRRRMGETIDERPREYDNDVVTLDPAHVRPTSAFRAGWFASYHAYPYYPDFLVYERGYAAYLQRLLAASDSLAVLISEYGVPYSLGIAHLTQDARDHGGHTEADGARVNAELTREIAASGAAGGVLFAWIDEWFKKNWVTIEFELPADRNRLWFNRLDAEQQYGVIAMDAARPLRWQTVTQQDGLVLSAASDEAYLRLRISGAAKQPVMIGFDVVDPKRGDFYLPGKVGPRLPAGVEFALVIRNDTVRLVADSASNPFRFLRVGGRESGKTLDFVRVSNAPAGFFLGRMHMRMNRPFRTIANADGAYSPLLVITNRQRYTSDGTQLIAAGYDRGLLPRGGEPDGLWEARDSVLEVRIPWGLLNFTDPSGKRVLQDGPRLRQEFGTVVVDSIRLVLALQRNGEWRTGVGGYELESWETPQYRARKRPVFDVMRDVFQTMKPGQ